MKSAIKVRFIAFLLLFVLPFSQNLLAQEVTVTGNVTDAETGEPIIGANIAVKGSTQGTITDMNGDYTLSALGEESVLVYSFVGYIKTERQVGDRRTINVALEVDRTEIEEIVVIGYGTQKKSDLTGAVAVVDADEMRKSSFDTFDKALQGRAAGVHISSVSGKPGETASIKVRGIGSISRSAEPLIIVDGMPVNSEYLNTLNPADIESTQILKDASATAIYGARGANGVIMVTTKKGIRGKPTFEFSTNYGLSMLPKTYNVMNADQYTEFMEAAYADMDQDDQKNMYYHVYSDSARASNGNLDTDTDWQDEIGRTGTKQSYNLSVSGGNEFSNYYVSGNYASEEGVLIGTGMERYGLNANSSFNLGDRIEVGESFSFSKVMIEDDSNYGNGNPWWVALVTSPYMPVIDETAIGNYGGPTDTLTGNNERTNPVAEQMLNEVTRDRYTVMGSVYADLELFKGLVYTIRIGGRYGINQDTYWNPKYTLGNMKLRDHPISKLEESNSYSQDLQMNNQLTYTGSFGNHHVAATAVWERFANTTNWNSAVGRYITDPDLNVLNQATEVFDVNGEINEHRLESYLARLQYDFAEKYYLTASYRVDGSTRFGPVGGRFGHFPSFSLGWKLNEDLLQDVDQVNMLKLRFGWGVTGNENLDDYQYLSLIDPLVNSRYVFGDPQEVYLGGAPTSFQANPRIKWESAKMTNFGVDLNAFRNRLQVTAEYYIKNQEDMLVKKPISVTFGKYVAYGPTETVGAWANLSKIQNRGFELTASWRKQEGPFNYSLSANFSTLKNEVIDLVVDDIVTNYTITSEGHSIGSFYGWVAERIIQESDYDEEGNYLHARQENGTAPGDIKFRDINNDGVIDDRDRTIIGKPFPDFIYGMNLSASYRGFDLVLFLQGMHNMEVYNDLMSDINIASGDETGKDQNRLVDCMDYWTPENPSKTMTRISRLDENLNSRHSSWFTYDASFLRIKTLQVGYSFPDAVVEALNVDRIRIYANMSNVYTFTSYPGYDPEIGDKDPLNMGLDLGHYPVPRIFSFGANLSF